MFRRSGIFVFYFIFATMIYHPCYTVLNGMYIHVYVNNDIPPLLHCFKWYVHTCIRHCHITYHFIERPAGATFHYMFAYNVWLTLLLLFTNYIQTIYKGHVLNFFLIDLMFLMYIYFCLFLVGVFFLALC
jgi:hypothetical protein